MKILYVISGLGVGGAEKVVTSLADSFAANGHEVVIVYLTGEALIKPSNETIQLVGLNVQSAWDMIKAYYQLRMLVTTFCPDVVHSHMVHSNILCRLLRLTTPIPKVISTVHNVNEGSQLRMLAYRFTDFLTDISTNVSGEAVEAFVEKKAVKSGRMLALHNGISTSNFVFSKRARCEIRSELGISEEQELILAVGSLSEQKDYPNLFAAVKNLVEKKDNFQVVIAGYGSLQAELENQLCLLGIEDKVRFLGIRQDISRLMSAADIFVLSSAWEGFGLVVAEAMACERIVVATDCGGVKEVVEDAGFLVPPRNSELLADALGNALLLNEDERHFMGVKARERIVSSFSLDASMHKWLQLYSSRTETFD